MWPKNKKRFFIYIIPLLLITLAVIIFQSPKKKLLLGGIPIINTLITPDTPQKIRIVIDAGHGGPDPGAKNYKYNILEKDIARQICAQLIKLADTSKYIILETRPNDLNINRHTRIQLANNFKPNMLLTIHCNSYQSKSVNGNEVSYSDSTLSLTDTTSVVNPNRFTCDSLARRISKNIAQSFPKMFNRGIRIRRDRIWMIYAGHYPSILVEFGYISNPKDILVQKDSSSQKLLAQTLWRSIDEHFNQIKN